MSLLGKILLIGFAALAAAETAFVICFAAIPLWRDKRAKARKNKQKEGGGDD